MFLDMQSALDTVDDQKLLIFIEQMGIRIINDSHLMQNYLHYIC